MSVTDGIVHCNLLIREEFQTAVRLHLTCRCRVWYLSRRFKSELQYILRRSIKLEICRWHNHLWITINNTSVSFFALAADIIGRVSNFNKICSYWFFFSFCAICIKGRLLMTHLNESDTYIDLARHHRVGSSHFIWKNHLIIEPFVSITFLETLFVRHKALSYKWSAFVRSCRINFKIEFECHCIRLPILVFSH